MKYTIDEDVVKSSKLLMPEILAILLLKTGCRVSRLLLDMKHKGIISRDDDGNYCITSHWDDEACRILLDSEPTKEPEDRIENLAVKLMEIFPKQKKLGTCHYFRGNKKDTTLRLKKFFKLYGTKYTDDQILEAARKYVASFNGNYAYMRILKYFIWKDQRKINEEGISYIEEISDLASYIDNDDASDEHSADWTSTLK